MSVLTDIMDRLTDISALRIQVNQLVAQQGEMRKIMLEQQKDIAETRGQLKAMIQIQSQQHKK